MKLTFLIIALLLPFVSKAGDSFDWDPITQADWRVAEDTANGIRHAVILFEKIIADDRRIDERKCYLTLYRRIKIFDATGRQWGDVQVPHLHNQQKIEEIRGRTMRPDGRELTLLPIQIFEKDLFTAEGVKVKQTSFSLPGVSDNCIVEYFVKYRLPEPNAIWIFQKEIALLHGEYRWQFYRGQILPLDEEAGAAIAVVPNYIWLHDNRTNTVERRPSGKDPEEAVFTIRDVPAFAKEPYSLPDIARQIQLRCYYADTDSPAIFWQELAQNLNTTLDDFCRNNQRVRQAAAAFGDRDTDTAKIEAAYNWCQKRIKNISYSSNGEGFKSNKTADETLERGYGTQADINYIFHNLLREMNIGARMAYVADRDKDLFMPEAQYWQFDRTLVAVPAGEGRYRFYSPGDAYLPATHVPWFNEGEQAFVVGDTNQQFVAVPFSNAKSNRALRVFTLRLDDDLKLAGELLEQRWGHSAQTIRLSVAQTAESERRQRLERALVDILPNAHIDSVSVEGLGEIGAPVTLKGRMKLRGHLKRVGERLLLQPFKLFRHTVNPFQADIRQHPIAFEYAYEINEALNIELPENWSVEALPADTMLANEVGDCGATFMTIGQRLSVQRRFRMNHPYWPPSAYPQVRELFQAQQALNASTVVLRSRLEKTDLASRRGPTSTLHKIE